MPTMLLRAEPDSLPNVVDSLGDAPLGPSIVSNSMAVVRFVATMQMGQLVMSAAAIS